MNAARLAVTVLALVAGCGAAGGLPGVPFCEPAHVQLCAPHQLRDGTRCAVCDSADLTLSCGDDDGHRATCVASCDACDDEPAQAPPQTSKAEYVKGISICGATIDWFAHGPRTRDSFWCGVCTDLNESLATEWCDSTGLDDWACKTVVCVATCDACAEVQ